MQSNQKQEPILISDSESDTPKQKHSPITTKRKFKKQRYDIWEEGRLVMTNGSNSISRLGIQDLIRSDLQRAFFSSYCIDDGWLMSLIPPNVPVCIARPKPADVPNGIDCITMSKFVQFVFPKMAFGFGVMHIKLFLLWYPDFIRVVIPSANLLKFDWNCIENVVFYQDFKRGDHQSSVFFSDLQVLLTKMGVPNQVSSKLHGFDYSKAIGNLVFSIPGWHHDVEKYGHTRLASVVKNLNLNFGTPVVTSQGSSLGALTERWCNEFYASCIGKDGSSNQNLQIVFPSRNSVFHAMGIIDHNKDLVVDVMKVAQRNMTGGTIHFKQKYWEQGKYPKACFHDCKALSNGLLHSKIIIVCKAPQNIGEIDLHAPQKDGFIYCGSHNTTQSAWGSLTVKGMKKLKILNYELGIVLPFGWGSGFKIPFQYPAPLYSADDMPWCVDEFSKRYPDLYIKNVHI
jgi:tyrosyl-DNA phosphodiesterase 1